MSDEKRRCLNCSAELHGEFCPACGQRDKEIHVPVKELASEFIDVLPSFDRRLRRSILPLIFSPGMLTLEYLAGKRKQYISPFKLYFAVSFLFFLVSSFADDTVVKNRALSGISSEHPEQTIKNDTAFVSVGNADNSLRFTVQDSAEVENVFGPKMKTALKNLKANPGLMFDKIKEHRPKIIFLLMPFFALLLKLLYLRSGTLYVKHLVFSFYFHSFLFIIFLLTELIDTVPFSIMGYLSYLLYLGIPVNLYYGLKRVYGQSSWKTAVKLFLLSVTYTITFFLSISAAALIIIYLFYT